jgi:hypothetical protein
LLWAGDVFCAQAMAQANPTKAAVLSPERRKSPERRRQVQQKCIEKASVQQFRCQSRSSRTAFVSQSAYAAIVSFFICYCKHRIPGKITRYHHGADIKRYDCSRKNLHASQIEALLKRLRCNEIWVWQGLCFALPRWPSLDFLGAGFRSVHGNGLFDRSTNPLN